MSLNWQWKEKRGYVESENLKEYPDWKCWIYHGNALMILIDENEKNNTWEMHGFFVDKEHGVNCMKDGIYQDHVFHLYKHKNNVKLAQILTKYMVTVIWEDMPNEQE